MSLPEPPPPRFFHSIHAIPGQSLRDAQDETGLPLIKSIRDLHSLHWNGWPPAGPRSNWRAPTELDASQAALNILSVALGVIAIKQADRGGSKLVGQSIPGFMQLGPDHFVEGSSCHWGLIAPAESFIRFDTAASLIRGEHRLPACLSQPHTLSLIDSHLLAMPRLPAQTGRCRILLTKVQASANDMCGPPPSLVLTTLSAALVFAALSDNPQSGQGASNPGAAILRLATQIANRMVDEASPVVHFDASATPVYVERPEVNGDLGIYINVQTSLIERLQAIAIAAMTAAGPVDTTAEFGRLCGLSIITTGPDGSPALELTHAAIGEYLDGLPVGQGAPIDDFDRAHSTGLLISLLLCEGGYEERQNGQASVVASVEAIRNAVQNFHMPHDHASRND